MHPEESTSFIHDGVTMTEYQNEPFIVGDYNHTQVEFMHLSHKKWYTASKLPFPDLKRVFGYAAVSRPGKVFLLGGSLHFEGISKILLYENDIWGWADDMKHARMNFMTITYGTDVMIIGGKSFQNEP